MRKFLFLMLFLPISVYAACSSSDLSRYKSMASNINYYYDYNGSAFDVTFYNVSNEFKVVEKASDLSYGTSSKFGDFVVPNLKSGSFTFAVYPASGDCSYYRVLTVYVNLPYLNKYYNDPVCVNSTSSLCFKWANTNSYSYEQFVNSVKLGNYQEIITEEPVPEYHKYGFFDFLGDYYIYILLFIIISGSIGIYFLDKKSRFDFQ